jgi:hypothetical protein
MKLQKHSGIFRLLMRSIVHFAKVRDFDRSKFYLSEWNLLTGTRIGADLEVRALFRKHSLDHIKFQDEQIAKATNITKPQFDEDDDEDH